MEDANESLAIVIPAYNEERLIEKTVREWIEKLRNLKIDFKMHVYNDGSTDSTFSRLEKLKHDYSELVIHNKKNSGHGPTILFGYLDNCECHWIFQTDSDREMDPEYFNSLWENRKNYDFLIGCRDGRRQPLARKIVSVFSRMIVHAFYGKGVFDVNSPYRLMRVSVFKPYFSIIPTDTFAPNLIISGIASLKKMRILECLVPQVGRKSGQVTLDSSMRILLKASFTSFVQTIKFRFDICCNDARP
ncbi:MAG: glycosyltransferase family 2 protein [Proteobacteria bacterium]|nr:glycosyltransferase family 2 protein [Pseudomonadota bacterium]